MRKKTNYNNIINKRFKIISFCVAFLFVFLIVNFFYVMIVKCKSYNKRLDKLNRNLVSFSSAPRGRILDRNYNIIVDNKALKTIVFKKDKKTTNKELIDLAYLVSSHIELDVSKFSDRAKREFYLAKYPDLGNSKISDDEMDKYMQKRLTSKDLYELKIERITDSEIGSFNDSDLRAGYLYYLMNRGYSYEEKVIKSDVSDLEYAYISENLNKLDGFNTRIDWERVYPYGDTLRSILGTVSSSEQGIPKEEKDNYLSKGYSLSDRVGISYLEKQYEEYLKGEKDIYEVVNSHNVKLVKEGKRGKDIVLTIDINLQQEVERIIIEQMKRAKGEANTEYYDHSSVIIQEPNTGEILAMASKKIVNGGFVDNITSILTSPITPGSVVKGASMLVGYNTGAIKTGEYILDECIKVSGVKEKCSYKTLGMINDITALAKSSNVYQFKTAIRVSGQEYFRGMKLDFNQEAFDKYRNMYHSFGLGVKTGIDLPIESSGYTSKDTNSGNLLDFVMGQYETYTPIQLAQYVNTIANGGKRLIPHLVKEVHDSTNDDSIGKLYLRVGSEVLNTVDTKEEYLNRVKEGFYAVMHSSGGYGVNYINKDFQSAGKTGTSQSFIDTNNDGIIDTETITSSFVGYLPFDNPKMSIVVTSPNSSRPNSYNDFTSYVTLRITKDVTNKYVEMYGLY